MRYLIPNLLCILLFINSKAYPQILTLKLNQSTFNTLKYVPTIENAFMSTDTLKKYKIKIGNNQDYVVKTYSLDYANTLYWKFKNGEIREDKFFERKKIYKISDSDFCKTRELHCEIKILYKMDKKGIGSYTFDTNCDNDFTNEKEYSTTDLLNISYVRVHNIETYINNKIVLGSLFVNKFEKYCDTSDLNDFEKKWSLCLKLKPFKWTTLEVGKSRINIACTNNTYFGLEFRKNRTDFYFIDNRFKVKGLIPQRFNDTIFINGKKIIIDSIDIRGVFLRLKFLKNESNKNYGFNEESIINNYLLNFTDSTTFQFGINRYKYILLDFWGTWCIPCKKMYELVDSLKMELNKTVFKDSILYINVALESQQSLLQYKDEMMHKYVDWKSVLLQNDKEDNIIKQLNIKAYPTLILISPQNKILSRITGIDQFYKTKKYFFQ